MTNKPESAAVEAVANMTPAKFTTRLADGSLILCVTESEHTQIVNANKSALDALRGEVERLKQDPLREALHKLVDAADDSDGACYGTLSTSFVRDIAKEALAKVTP